MIKFKIFFKYIFILLLCLGCGGSDIAEKVSHGYEFIIEGGNQNRVIKNNKLLVDSGLVEYKYDNNYIVFSVDTTYSMNPKKTNKDILVYYFHDLEKDIILENISCNEFKKIIKKKHLNYLDISCSSSSKK